MTSDELIAEGRRLARPSVVLTSEGERDLAAIWYGPSRAADESEFHCWIAVDSLFIPKFPTLDSRILSVFTDERDCHSGRIEFSDAWPDRPGASLYARSEDILPPIDAVFAKGSDAVRQWLAANRWERNWGFNNNFQDRKIVEEYNNIFTKEYPLYRDEVYATLGGWHSPWPEDDWGDLIDEQLLVMTIKDSEPWVETWKLRAGDYRVIQRIT